MNPLCLQDRIATSDVLAEGARTADKMRDIVRPHFLRREKATTAMVKVAEAAGARRPDPGEASSGPRQMPPKTDLIVWLGMHDFQRALYTVRAVARAVGTFGSAFSARVPYIRALPVARARKRASPCEATAAAREAAQRARAGLLADGQRRGGALGQPVRSLGYQHPEEDLRPPRPPHGPRREPGAQRRQARPARAARRRQRLGGFLRQRRLRLRLLGRFHRLGLGRQRQQRGRG